MSTRPVTKHIAVRRYDDRMTGTRLRRSPAYQLALGAALGFGLASAISLSACGPVVPPPASSRAPASVASVEPSAAASPSSSTSAPQAGQTDTDWGRIWDTLPASFPIYPGATPAEQTETGPVSAAFALQGIEPKAVATWMQTQMKLVGYTTEALTGPLEDGSFVLDSTGMAGCRVEVAVAPLGSLTTVTVRYGAACPNP